MLFIVIAGSLSMSVEEIMIQSTGHRTQSTTGTQLIEARPIWISESIVRIWRMMKLMRRRNDFEGCNVVDWSTI